MSGPTITITVDSKGAVTVETKGFAGTSCRDATRALEQALGQVLADQPTSELYRTAPLTNPARLRTDG